MFPGLPATVNLQGRLRLTIAAAAGALGWWLAPPRCVLCGSAGAAARLDLCVHCLRRLPVQAAAVRFDEPAFDALLAPWHYGYPVDAMLRALKFQGELAHGRVLGSLLGRQRLSLSRALPSLVVPMPLHPARLAERGYNQARELAAAAANACALPLDCHLLNRIRNTRPQTRLDRVSRRNNMRSAFACTRQVDGQDVALVDDVTTTGATARAAAIALRAAGVRRLEFWVAARVVRGE